MRHLARSTASGKLLDLSSIGFLTNFDVLTRQKYLQEFLSSLIYEKIYIFNSFPLDVRTFLKLIFYRY
jgi:hypothetical protein